MTYNISFKCTTRFNIFIDYTPFEVIIEYWASLVAGLPLVAQVVKNPLAMQETWVQSLGWDDPLE